MPITRARKATLRAMSLPQLVEIKNRPYTRLPGAVAMQWEYEEAEYAGELIRARSAAVQQLDVSPGAGYSELAGFRSNVARENAGQGPYDATDSGDGFSVPARPTVRISTDEDGQPVETAVGTHSLASRSTLTFNFTVLEWRTLMVAAAQGCTKVVGVEPEVIMGLIKVMAQETGKYDAEGNRK